jgi:tRNA 5-methylaminomethyl-2-thiouridine biosynthesis bifunctional protein
MQIIVIGAGLAGAASAHALALRGCEVTVLEAFSASSLLRAPSGAPSAGLPVALMAPHHTLSGAAPSAISQLSRLGLSATTAAAKALLLQGQDWQPSGTLQRAGKLGPQAHWFADAAWVKPAALVAAWLAHPRITVRTGIQVHTVHPTQGAAPSWQALDAQGLVLAQADACVLANAYQARALLERLSNDLGTHAAASHLQRLASALHQVAGQIVYGPWTDAWQARWPALLPELPAHRPTPSAANATAVQHFCAINGNGHFIPAVPWGHSGERIWLSGSTYEHDAPHDPQITPQGITANLQRLQQLIPAAADLLAQQHSAGQLQGWAGTRCTTRERLPLVGAIPEVGSAGLYLCTAMGSRGLSFAALCGQHVASMVMPSQDSPLPTHLQRAILPGAAGRAA